MIGSKVTISLWCNNKKIEKELLKGDFSEIDFVGQIHLQKPDYYCIFLDLEDSLEEADTILIDVDDHIQVLTSINKYTNGH